MHVAELNIAMPRFDLESPNMRGFTSNLDRVNAIAERSPGFVWRLVGDGNDATDLRHPDFPDAIVNISVWENAEALEHFVWNTIHKQIYSLKGRWFDPLAKPHFVMWNVSEGEQPTLDEAIRRLDHLTRHGSTDHAFGWDGLPHLKRWLEARCA
jgi:hypothetical protein